MFSMLAGLVRVFDCEMWKLTAGEAVSSSLLPVSKRQADHSHSSAAPVTAGKGCNLEFASKTFIMCVTGYIKARPGL